MNKKNSISSSFKKNSIRSPCILDSKQTDKSIDLSLLPVFLSISLWKLWGSARFVLMIWKHEIEDRSTFNPLFEPSMFSIRASTMIAVMVIISRRWCPADEEQSWLAWWEPGTFRVLEVRAHYSHVHTQGRLQDGPAGMSEGQKAGLPRGKCLGV